MIWCIPTASLGLRFEGDGLKQKGRSGAPRRVGFDARSYDPVPVRVTFCGLPPPSSLILTDS